MKIKENGIQHRTVFGKEVPYNEYVVHTKDKMTVDEVREALIEKYGNEGVWVVKEV